jgi:hypothetical protein
MKEQRIDNHTEGVQRTMHTDKREAFRVSWEKVVLNWGKAVLLGTVIWPIVAGITEIGSFEWSHIEDLIPAYFFVAMVSLALSIVLSIPALLLLIGVGELLNKSNLSFHRYRMRQNTLHVGIAAATFITIYYYSGNSSEQEFLLVSIISFVYTFSGLYVWNRMYYRLNKTTKNQ